MTRKMAVTFHKGGVGKTATVQNLGYELAQLAQKVLLVDFDPQANLTTSYGFTGGAYNTVYDFIREPEQKSAIMNLAPYNLDLLPANLDLADAELELGNDNIIPRQYWLREALDSIEHNYDIILIDTPPSLGFFAVNALFAANELLVPLQCEYLAYDALDQFLRVFHKVGKYNRSLVNQNGFFNGGILLTMRDGRINLSSEVEEVARERFGSMVYETVIPENVSIKEAPALGKPVALYKPNSRGAKAYKQLALELLRGLEG